MNPFDVAKLNKDMHDLKRSRDDHERRIAALESRMSATDKTRQIEDVPEANFWNMENKPFTLEVGKRYRCRDCFEGVLKKNVGNSEYPLLLRGDNGGGRTYTDDGKWSACGLHPEWNIIAAVEPAAEPPQATYASGEPPMVGDVVKCVKGEPHPSSIHTGCFYVVNAVEETFLWVEGISSCWFFDRFTLIRRASPESTGEKSYVGVYNDAYRKAQPGKRNESGVLAVIAEYERRASPEPTGKSYGQIAYDAYKRSPIWDRENPSYRKMWEASAEAVAAAVRQREVEPMRAECEHYRQQHAELRNVLGTTDSVVELAKHERQRADAAEAKVRCLDETNEEAAKAIEQLTAERNAAIAEVKKNYDESVYWLETMCPQIAPAADTSGVLSQISNYVAGLTAERDAARAVLADAQQITIGRATTGGHIMPFANSPMDPPEWQDDATGNAPRPVENCGHVNDEDGLCEHPLNMTPECHDGACPLVYSCDERKEKT